MKSQQAAIYVPEAIANRIFTLRGQKVILDSDLAARVAAQPGGGCVVQLLDSRIARPEAGAFRGYAATKRELADSVARLAREWAPKTRVNGVAPGPVLAPEDVREAAGDLPLGRRPTPEDVARAVAFLAESDSITGQILFVDGGQHLAGADHA